MNLEIDSQSHQAFLAPEVGLLGGCKLPFLRHVDVESFDDAAVHDPILGAWPGV